MTVFSMLVERYGDDATLHKGDETFAARIFLQPVMTRAQDRRFSQMTPLGERDRGRFYAFLSAGEWEELEYICHRGTEYTVLRMERYRVHGETSHLELLLEKREEEYDGGD